MLVMVAKTVKITGVRSCFLRKNHSFGLMTRFFAAIACCVVFASCRPDTYTPKPRGYYRIDYPEHKYQVFNKPGYPYSFEYPVYASIEKDTTEAKPENPYWINMIFPTLGGEIYISYKEISAQQPLEKLLEDSYHMSFYHSKRADYINDPAFHNEASHVHGVFYDVGGNAASSYQFYATDSVKHFIRAALYFNVTPNADSLRPVNEFLRVDMEHMLETLKWN